VATTGKRRTTVLLVDDEPFFLQLLSDFFTEEEFGVITAKNGGDAVARARKHRPDLILLDLHMPAPDGLATCKNLKADKATRGIPVIILTAEESTELNQMAFDAGAQVTALKSMKLDRLMNIVDVVLQTRKLPDPRILPEA
jgi:two-component system alkaline phosphatase synthesis response regulator PhoP